MKKEIKGYIVLGALILLTVVLLIGLRNKNNVKDNTDVSQNSQNQTENQNTAETRQLKPREKYLYADIEDATYEDVIKSEDNLTMSREGFKKYNTGKIGDTITTIEKTCEMGKEIEMDKVTQFYVKVISFDTYESYEAVEKLIDDSKKLINIPDDGADLKELDEGCVYAAVKFSLSSNCEKMTAYDTTILNVYQVIEDEKDLYTDALPDSKSDKYVHPNGYIFDKETMFAENVGINTNTTFKYELVGKDIEYMWGIQDVVIPIGETVEVIQVYEVPKEIINSERLVFGSFLYAKSMRQNHEFSIYLNRK